MGDTDFSIERRSELRTLLIRSWTIISAVNEEWKF